MTDHLAPPPTIIVNGQPTPLPHCMTLRQLIISLGMGQQAAAAEINGKLVRRSLHETTTLAAGDKIEIVSLVGGG